MAIMLVILVFLAVLITGGAIYEWRGLSSDKRKHPPPGRLVDVGGYHLHIHCLGEQNDGPAVVFEAGSGGSGLDWALVQPEVAQFAPACVYDRAGYGWSEHGPKPRTLERIADELLALLTNAGLKEPYIIVGHAFGGIIARVFIKRHPEKVSGLVLVDSSHPKTFTNEEINLRSEVRRLRRVAFVRRIGLIRRFRAKIFRQANALPAEEQPRYWAICLRNAYAVPDEVRGILKQGLDLPDSIGSIPLAVVSRSPIELLDGTIAESSQRWQAVQEELATLSANSTHVVAEKGGRYVQFDQPEVVIGAIRQIVETIRTGSQGR